MTEQNGNAIVNELGRWNTAANEAADGFFNLATAATSAATDAAGAANAIMVSAYDARMNAVSAKYKRGIGYNPLNYPHARERAREAERFIMKMNAATRPAGGGGGGTTNVTVRVEGGINIHGVDNPADAAAGIDHELAVRVRNNRSELRIAFDGLYG